MKTTVLVSTLLLFSMANANEFKLSDLKVESDYNQTKESELGETVNLLTSKQLEDSNATSTEDILNSIPGLNFTAGSNRPKFLQIRGIGERSLYEGSPNHSVGIKVDNIDMSGMGSVGSLYDIEQIEVVKTSQATKYGSNALAGFINYKTKNPSNKKEVSGTATYGSYNTQKGGVSFNSPIDLINSELRLSLFSEKSDGFIKNEYLDKENTQGIEEYTFRFKLNSRLGSDISSEFATYLYKQNNGYDAWSHDSSLNTMSDNPGEDDINVIGSSLKITKYMSSGDKIQSTTSYALSFEEYSYDEDWGNDEYWNNLAGYNANYNYYAENRRKRNALSEELRYQGSGYNIGFYAQRFVEEAVIKSFKNNAERVDRRIEGQFDRNTFSIFGDKTIDLGEKSLLTIGTRLEHYNATYSTRSNQLYKDNNNLIGANIKLEYFPNKGTTQYINISRGYKQGGMNTEKDLSDDKRIYRPEYMYGLEIGSKNTWTKNFYTTAALFGNLRTDAQVKATSQDDPLDPNSFTYYNGNAAKSYQTGADLTFNSQLGSRVSLSGSASLLRAKFIDYKYESINKKSRDLAQAPKFQFDLRGKYSITDSIGIIAEYAGKDGFYFSDTHDKKSHYYGLVNLTLKMALKNIDLALWSKNIFNKSYATRGFFFANEPPAWEDKLYTQNGAPRTIGVTLRGHF